MKGEKISRERKKVTSKHLSVNSTFDECQIAFKEKNPLGRLYLARFYIEGIGVKKNLQLAACLLELAWRDRIAIPPMHWNFFYKILVALALEKKGFDHLFVWKRACWFRKLAFEYEQDPRTLRLCQACFEKAKEYEEDNEKAFHLYNQASEMGYPPAINNLAICYIEGIGTEINYKRAAMLFWMAALWQCQAAVYNLGRCYELGLGVNKNLQVAKKYYEFSWG